MGTATHTPSATAILTLGPSATASPAAPPPFQVAKLLKLVPYPNPSRGPLQLRVQTQGAVETVKISIFTPSMVLVLKTEINVKGGGWHSLTLPPGTLPAGLYFVRADSPWQHVTTRLVRLP